ncbi:hypothetical protein MTCD1_03272 [Colwellia marinimaniae]|uniref:Transposase DDE domain-containing protein n=1 Tax=Colwellia marinimaniae TaxID=1513592 RepID=A0ABQ0MZA6_9GAMM|nr:hypothetical protein MTCD1_03272 [Colwellia marinimaniae]
MPFEYSRVTEHYIYTAIICKRLTGKLYADKGYIGKKLSETLKNLMLI